MDLGMAGIGLYWCMIECLYENGGYLDLSQIDLLAYELRVDKKLIEDLIDNYDLFKKNKKSFYSKSVLQRLEKINEISKKNKENVKKRWAKIKQTTESQANNDRNTTVLPSNYKIKEKENKNKSKIKNNIITTTTTTNIYNFIEENFGRTLAPVEYEKINEWLLSFDEEIIKYAVKIAVLKSTKTFNYVSGILNNWKGKNFKTLSEIKDEEKNIKNRKSSQLKEVFDYDWLNESEE